jgi:hypothetical protein
MQCFGTFVAISQCFAETCGENLKKMHDEKKRCALTNFDPEIFYWNSVEQFEISVKNLKTMIGVK